MRLTLKQVDRSRMPIFAGIRDARFSLITTSQPVRFPCLFIAGLQRMSTDFSAGSV